MKMHLILTFSLLTVELGHSLQTNSHVSILGDPGLQFKPDGPRIMIEAWNFCNRAGPSFADDPILPSPRYGDCVIKNSNCTFGPNKDNCVSEQLNNLTDHSNNQNGTSNDQLSIEKELALGAACNVNNSYFWSTMLKNGNFDQSFNICSTSPYQPYGNSLSSSYTSDKLTKHRLSSSSSGVGFDNKPMNQPRVYHSYTNMTSDASISSDSNMHMNGMFYGTWDLNATTDAINGITAAQLGAKREAKWNNINININPNISYFSLSWYYNETSKSGVLSNYIQTSEQYPWLMLYTGVDVSNYEKGQVPYKGCGMMSKPPLVYHNITTNYTSYINNFIITFKLSLNYIYPITESASSFYFLNIVSCWTNDGLQCTGDTNKDVTQQVLMETNPNYNQHCNINNKFGCPRYHTFINGTIISRNDSGYPFDAYKEWCIPWECNDYIEGESKCDAYSNPMQQSIMKIAPHDEWKYHGFPYKSGQGWIITSNSSNNNNTQTQWTLDVGNLLNRLFFACQKPIITKWSTFNIGPEAGIGDWQGYSNKFQWDIENFDVLVPNVN